MDSEPQHEVTIHRHPQPEYPHEAGYRAEPAGTSAPQANLSSAEDPDDDLPVSSEQPDSSARFAAPSYGAMGPPAALDEFDLESLSTYSGSPAADQTGAGAVPQLDAWYAAYGHPALAALLRQPGVAAAIANIAPDGDERAPVDATEAYPWRCICALAITAADGSRWLGTGWLIGPRTVITAGHCVYLDRHGGWVRQVEVVPGQNGDQRPYGAVVAASFRSVRGWARKRLPGYDYGVIILPPERALGNLLGYFGYANLSDQELHGARLNLAGYPSDRPRGTQWYQARRLDYLTPRTLEYAVENTGGHSGAPLWRVRDGVRYVVGIHAVGDGAAGAAIRVNAPVFANLSAWQREGA